MLILKASGQGANHLIFCSKSLPKAHLNDIILGLLGRCPSHLGNTRWWRQGPGNAGNVGPDAWMRMPKFYTLIASDRSNSTKLWNLEGECFTMFYLCYLVFTPVSGTEINTRTCHMLHHELSTPGRSPFRETNVGRCPWRRRHGQGLRAFKSDSGLSLDVICYCNLMFRG